MANFELTEFVAEDTRVNEWIDPIKALAEAIEANPKAAFKVTVEWAKRNTELLAIREAAKQINKTVRVRAQDESGLEKIGTTDKGKSVYKGDIIYTISLTDKYKDGRGRKPADKAEAETPAKGK